MSLQWAFEIAWIERDVYNSLFCIPLGELGREEHVSGLGLRIRCLWTPRLLFPGDVVHVDTAFGSSPVDDERPGPCYPHRARGCCLGGLGEDRKQALSEEEWRKAVCAHLKLVSLAKIEDSCQPISFSRQQGNPNQG